MLLKEILNESVIKCFGPKFKATGQLPQFTKSKRTAEVLADYCDMGEVFEVELTIKKPAKNDDVEEVANKDDLEQHSTAELVAAKASVRKALKLKGFDGFADVSVLENTEPMQYVAFDKAQVKYLA